jgi:hypothetical protein
MRHQASGGASPRATQLTGLSLTTNTAFPDPAEQLRYYIKRNSNWERLHRRGFDSGYPGVGTGDCIADGQLGACGVSG